MYQSSATVLVCVNTLATAAERFTGADTLVIHVSSKAVPNADVEAAERYLRERFPAYELVGLGVPQTQYYN